VAGQAGIDDRELTGFLHQIAVDQAAGAEAVERWC
jgi:hypothetical protein